MVSFSSNILWLQVSRSTEGNEKTFAHVKYMSTRNTILRNLELFSGAYAYVKVIMIAQMKELLKSGSDSHSSNI